MHFFKNSVSFIAVMCVFGAAYAAVAPGRGRVGVVGVASSAGTSRRLPSLISIMRPGTSTTTTTTTSNTDVPLLSDQQCVDKYRTCMKAGNACGSNFEECTTNVLFHGHMGECFSTLYQCSSAGINNLFGTTDLDKLSQVDYCIDGTGDKDVNGNWITDENGNIRGCEVGRYTYPTDGSIMGMDIIGAATRNKLSTADCVKKYKKCLNKDSICGEDFELCTTPEEFQRQAAMCDSTLARCQKEGFQQLFGDSQTVKPVGAQLATSGGSTLQWVNDGAALAAANAVNTCYKVIDSCFTNACKKNPYRCVDGTNKTVVEAADWVGGDAIRDYNFDEESGQALSHSDVRKFFRAACENTIGSNKYCFMTFREGKNPTKQDLLDEDNQSDVFDDAYNARQSILKSKIQDSVTSFNKTAQDKCLTTFKSCAINSCAGGSGAACYNAVFGGVNKQSVQRFGGLAVEAAKNETGSINGTNTYDSIAQGCSGIVNTDANCLYMAAVQATTDGYTYSSFEASNGGAFDVLFPKQATGGTTPVVVAALNAELSSAYNDVAIENMKKQCRNTIVNCAKSLCGKDYQNCYRNRSDISIAAYDTGNTNFDRSMNKAGGVLDYTIVQGLCMNTVNNSDICAESLAIAKYNLSKTKTFADIENSNTLSSAWRNSAGGVQATTQGMVVDTDENGRELCDCTDTGGVDICAHVDGGNPNCTQKHYSSYSVALNTKAQATLFQEVLADVEREAQAQYKAKLTKEQNICLAQNGGTSPNATYVWAKLKSKRLPDQYETKGLRDGSVASNDLYNSFCRIKIDLRSDDRDLQTLLNGGSIQITETKTGLFGIDGLKKDRNEEVKGGGDETKAYFAAGDTFQCGSWVSDTTLNAMSEKVASDARKEAGQGSQREKTIKLWTTLGVGLAGGVGSYFGMDALQRNGKSLGGLLKKTTSSTAATQEQQNAGFDCVKNINEAKAEMAKLGDENPGADTNWSEFASKVNLAKANAKKAGVTSSYSFDKPGTKTSVVWASARNNVLLEWQTALNGIGDCKYEVTVTEGGKTSTKKETSSDCNTAKQQAKIVVDWLKNSTPDTDKTFAAQAAAGKAVQYTSFTNLTTDFSGLVDTSESAKGKWRSNFESSLDSMQAECQAVADNEEKPEDRKARLGKNIAAGVVGSVATSALAAGIVSSVQKAKYEQAADEAVKEWMENVGSKIHCYVNGEMVGDFGDVVTINIDAE